MNHIHRLTADFSTVLFIHRFETTETSHLRRLSQPADGGLLLLHDGAQSLQTLHGHRQGADHLAAVLHVQHCKHTDTHTCTVIIQGMILGFSSKSLSD